LEVGGGVFPFEWRGGGVVAAEEGQQGGGELGGAGESRGTSSAVKTRCSAITSRSRHM